MASYDLSVARPQPAEGRRALGRLVNGLLFITILSSGVVFIEPAPYEALFALLALVCLFAGLKLDRTVVPLALLLLVWNLGGLVSVLPVIDDRDAVVFIAVSFYLAVTAVLFAGLFSREIMHRLALLRTAYLMAAVVAALIGIAAYFQLIPGSELFTLGGTRAQSTFKDPNVFGPFLILPLLFIFDAGLRRGVRVRDLVLALILLVGLFLSFSRGAWANFLLSVAVAMALMFLISPDLRFRARILAFALIAAATGVALIAALLSLDAVGAMFEERASLLQDYDAGPSGRFGRQVHAFFLLLELPLGMGPLQFGRQFGQNPHNVYLNAFLSYGWIGGVAYLALVASTLVIGFRALFVRTPWQPYLVVVLAAFVGTAGEGIVIDTDHWRHFYLLLGMTWGLAAATERARRAGETLCPC